MRIRAARWVALAVILLAAPLPARPATRRDLPFATLEAAGVDHEALAAPGARWTYTDVYAQLAASLLEYTRARLSLPVYADKFLLDPLGCGPHSWAFHDALGVYFGGYGLRLRARDMAKFGHLYLQKGAWNGKQLVPEKWVAESTRDQTGHQYGYLWWSHFPEITYHSYSAIGVK